MSWGIGGKDIKMIVDRKICRKQLIEQSSLGRPSQDMSSEKKKIALCMYHVKS
jgi:hypothetical protein